MNASPEKLICLEVANEIHGILGSVALSLIGASDFSVNEEDSLSFKTIRGMKNVNRIKIKKNLADTFDISFVSVRSHGSTLIHTEKDCGSKEILETITNVTGLMTYY